MKKYIALGCSLTALPGYVNHLNKKYKLGIVNLAVPASSNALQSFKLNNCLINGDAGRETTLLWQLTGIGRSFAVVDPDTATELDITYKHQTSNFNGHLVTIEPYDIMSSALLSNSEHAKQQLRNDVYQLQTTICDIYKWSHLVDRIIVYLGWSWIDESGQLLNKLLSVLEPLPNVTIIPPHHSILDYCIKQQLPILEDNHPEENSYNVWCENVLVPRLGINNA